MKYEEEAPNVNENKSGSTAVEAVETPNETILDENKDGIDVKDVADASKEASEVSEINLATKQLCSEDLP